jgi:phenylpropionate dioxygenase-like ring-hydroxylating dioxygenase large terminal subunit
MSVELADASEPVQDRSMTGYAVDPDIARARTLPGSFYRDDDVWRRQCEQLFARHWHLYPEGALPAEGGDAVPWSLLPGALDEPLLLLRDDEELVCLSNACSHRGALLVDAPCSFEERSIRCPYHGRRFDHQGRCLSAMGFSPPFTDDADLPRAAFGELGSIGMAALHPTTAFEELIAPIRARTGWLPWDRLTLDTTARYRFAANWALYVDNYLEGLHIPFVHPALAKAVDLASYEVELTPHGSLQWGRAAPGEVALEPPAGHRDHELRVAAYYFFVFPCTMVNVYPWGVSTNAVIPRGIADTEVRFFSWIWDAALRDQGAGGDLHRVEMEDEAVVQRVQRGIGGRLYTRGRYAPDHERAVHHFHRALTRSEEPPRQR